jgi:Fe-S-cluster-containing dehydrogenase component
MRRRVKATAPGRLVVLAENCRGCRSCQLACSFVRTRVFNPGRSMIVLERDLASGRTAPMIKPIGCDLCGGDPACANACKYGAIAYEPGQSEEKIVVRPWGKEGS